MNVVNFLFWDGYLNATEDTDKTSTDDTDKTEESTFGFGEFVTQAGKRVYEVAFDENHKDTRKHLKVGFVSIVSLMVLSDRKLIRG